MKDYHMISKPLNPSAAWLFIGKGHLVQGKLAQASWLLKVEGVNSPRRVACLGLKKFHGSDLKLLTQCVSGTQRDAQAQWAKQALR
ncbi:hypothetical protein JHK87_006587 [Glycine soja]|nr:hypothetical protein JHK87_006587 [Glycine soja]